MRYLLIIAIFTFAGHAEAWQRMPGKSSPMTVAVDSSGLKIMTYLLRGGYWMSEDGGATWTEMNQAVSAESMPAAAFSIDSYDAGMDTIVIRGGFHEYPTYENHDQQIAMTTDGGLTWTFPFDEPLSNLSEHMIIDRNNPNILHYIGFQFYHRSQDMGMTWPYMTNFNPRNNMAYELIQDEASSDLYAITIYSQEQEGGLLRSINGGNTWEYLLPPALFPGYDSAIITMDVELLSDTEILVPVPYDFQLQTIDALLRSETNGTDWTVEYPDLPPNYWITEVSQSGSPDQLLARSSTVFPYWSKPLLYSEDGGHVWNAYEENHKVNNVNDLAANKFSDEVYVSVFGGGAYRIGTDNTLEELPMPPYGSESDVIIRDHYISYSPAFGDEVYFLQDGQPLRKFYYPQPNIQSMLISYPVFASRNDTLFGLYARRQRESVRGQLHVVQSPDQGETWQLSGVRMPLGPHSADTPLYHGYDQGVPYTIFSTEFQEDQWVCYVNIGDPLSWTRIEIPGTTNRSISSYRICDGYLYAVHFGEGVYRYSFEDGDWEDLNHPAPNSLYDPDAVVIRDDLDAIYTLGGVYGYKYVNGEWQMTGLFATGNLWKATAIPRDDGEPVLLTSTGRRPGIHVSDSGGAGWSPIDPPLPHMTQMTRTADLYYDPWRNRIWVNTPLGLMWEDASLFTSVREDEGRAVPVSHELLTVYPNPFNGQTTVRFVLDRGEAVTVTVYNLLGEEVARLVDGEERSVGEHVVTLNGSRLASGSYFVRLTTPSGRAATRKLDLVK